MARRKPHESDPRRNTRQRVKEFLSSGRTVSEIAADLSITRARVYQHLRAIRKDAA